MLTATPADTPTPTLPAQWQHAAAPSPLQIDEVAYDGSDGEYVVLANVSGTDLSLAGWVLGDAERPATARACMPCRTWCWRPEGCSSWHARQMHSVPSTAADPMPRSKLPATPSQLVRRKDLAKGKLALNDSGDEIVLLAPGLLLADAVAFGKGEYGVLGLAGDLRAPAGYSLQRVPGASFPQVADVRHRFLAAPPRPFELRGLPLGAPAAAAALDGGYIGVWGSLGAHSNFTAGYTAPPHYLLAAAAAQGLQFMAVADTAVTVPPVLIPDAMTVLPAWEWQGSDAGSAVIYNDARPYPTCRSMGWPATWAAAAGSFSGRAKTTLPSRGWWHWRLMRGRLRTILPGSLSAGGSWVRRCCRRAMPSLTCLGRSQWRPVIPGLRCAGKTRRTCWRPSPQAAAGQPATRMHG